MAETNNVGSDNQPRYTTGLSDSIAVTAAPARLLLPDGVVDDDDQGVGLVVFQADHDNTQDVILGAYSDDDALVAMTTAQGIRLAPGAFSPQFVLVRMDKFQARSVSGTQSLRYFVQK